MKQKPTYELPAALRTLMGVVVLSMAMPLAGFAQDGCFADYKAKRSQQGALQLHYGVIQLPAAACSRPARASKIVERRIAGDGWTLLRVMSVFDSGGLNQRRGNAGQYFLRY